MAGKQTEAKITFKAVTSEFTEGIRNCNKTLKTMQNELKLNKTQLEGNSDSVELKNQKQQSLKKAMAESEQKIQLTNQKLEQAKQVLGENSNEYKNLYNSVITAKRQYQVFANELSNTESKLDSLSNATSQSESSLDKLERTISQQRQELSSLQREYQNVVLEQGKSSSKATALAGDIQKLTRELSQNQQELSDVEQASKEVGGGFDDLGGALGSIESASGGVKGSLIAIGTALGNLASSAIQAAIGKIKEFTEYLWELPESTEEYRSMMGKLEASTTQAGYSMGKAKEQYRLMNSYLNDSMASTNAITNLQKLGLSQEQLTGITQSAISVWSQYGDSIPIESLTESITETAQVGKVTGNLADALNWAGISEDAFNAKLEKCSSTSQRAKLIQDTLNNAYGEGRKKYDEATESQRAYQEAQDKLIEAEAKLAEAVLPAKTALTNFKAQALEAMRPVIDAVINGIKGLCDWFNNLSPAAQQVVTSIGMAIGIVASLAAIFLAGKLAVMGVSVAFGMLNLSLLPVIGVILAVTAVVGGIILVIRNWGNITDWVSKKWKSFKKTISSIWNSIKAKCSEVWNAIKAAITEKVSSMVSKAVATYTSMKTKVQNIWNGIKSFAKTAWEGVKNNIINPVKTAYNKVRDTFNNIKNTISSAVSKIKNMMHFSWSLPKPRIPHFSVSGGEAPWGFMGKGSLPKVSISWHAKGGIFNTPTLFNTMNGLHGVGEAGAEAIIPLDGFYKHLDEKIESLLGLSIIDYDRMANAMATAMSNTGVYMDSTQVGQLTAKAVDNVNKSRMNRLSMLGGVR